MSFKNVLAASLLVLGATSTAQGQAYQIANRASISGPTLNWMSILGSPGQQINPTIGAATGVPGLNVTVTDPSWASVQQQTAPGNWHGNFAQGDPVLFAMGPVSLQFSNDIYAFGAQVQSNIYGNFTGVIKAYDFSNVLLGSFSVNGWSSGAADNSAVFLGIGSNSGMRRITFEAFDGNSQRALGINQATIGLEGEGHIGVDQGPTSAVPEPGTVALTAAGLLGLVAAQRRRRAKTD